MLPTAPDAPARNVSGDARNLAELLRLRAEQSGPHPALYAKVEGAWRATSWADFYDLSLREARALVDLGVEPGDRVAILGPTRIPWCVHDMACQLAGAVSFGVYPMQTPEQIRYLLTHSEAKAILVDGEGELQSVLEAAREAPALTAIIPWSAALYQVARGRDPRIVDPACLSGQPLDAAEVRARGEARRLDDVAVLVYTSGTTGPPKAAMISHGNILTLLRAYAPLAEVRSSDIALSFLPMAHVAERILSFYSRIDLGLCSAYASSMAAVLDELREVQPTIFGSVPRLFEKAHARVWSELERRPPAVQRLFRWAIDVGRRALPHRLAGAPLPLALALQHRVADRLVFRKIRAAFGGRVQRLLVGAAPTDRAILEFFWAVGIPLYEVFGMTEATVITHANFPGATRLGTVGRPLPGIEQRLADDGELLLRGPWVFLGYFKDPAATAAALEGGWLHTGDIAAIDEGGYLTIKDRKKHLIITAGGKNLAPANIEGALKSEDPLISHVHAHGDRRPYVTAIIAPSPLETLDFGLQRGVLDKAEVDARAHELIANPSARTPELAAAMARVVVHPDFQRRIRGAVGRGNKHLAHVEQVRRFLVLDRDFSQEQGELTPTLKVKRGELEKKYAAELARLYDDPAFGLEPAADV